MGSSKRKENSSKPSLFSPSRLMMLTFCFQCCCSLPPSLFGSVVHKGRKDTG
uniref:Uncharacterized protein n=1 Tax=Mus musculus TaxID=10090 RepID=Q3TZ40_MOUSE|nr:unnamed protein product [Mus musculus]